jgi:hypothetical protein
MNSTECVIGVVALEKISSTFSVYSETLNPPTQHKFQNHLKLGALVNTNDVRLPDVISDWQKHNPQLRRRTEDGRDKRQ